MTETRFDVAEHGVPGWHYSTADGGCRRSGCGHTLDTDYLNPGAFVIDKEPIFEADSFVADVFACPLIGPDRRGFFLDALREAPHMAVAVEAFGLAGATLQQARVEASGDDYGPMDTAPPEYHARYWADRGAIVTVWNGTELVPWGVTS